jgi:hypothetical protein
MVLVFGDGCGSVTEQQGTGGAGGHAGGAGGTTGAAGQAGGGTTGSAGQGGSGGQPIDGGESCDQLVTDYANAFAAARTCTPGAANQCQQLAAPTLTTCAPCPQYVNDTTKLTAIQAEWRAQGCALPILCPQIACILPGPSTCLSNDAGTAPGGICSVGVPLPTS